VTVGTEKYTTNEAMDEGLEIKWREEEMVFTVSNANKYCKVEVFDRDFDNDKVISIGSIGFEINELEKK
jgi:hypothetical protein